MISNVSLAITVALILNVKEDDIQERLYEIKPGEFRGEWYTFADQFLYADCYNANPYAMRDALAFFDSYAPESFNRLYVLGSMAELGDRASQIHKDMSQFLHLRNHDRVVCIGRHAEDYAEGIFERYKNKNQVLCLENTADAATIVNEFKGSLFLKGSKVNKLWELIPEKAKKMDRIPSC